jgi:hypothetical protein
VAPALLAGDEGVNGQKSSQQGPSARGFSRGWVEIGVDFSNLASIGVGFKGIPLRSFAPFVVNDFAFSEILGRFEHTSARNLKGLVQTT